MAKARQPKPLETQCCANDTHGERHALSATEDHRAKRKAPQARAGLKLKGINHAAKVFLCMWPTFADPRKRLREP